MQPAAAPAQAVVAPAQAAETRRCADLLRPRKESRYP